jgi:hypothetical protein
MMSRSDVPLSSSLFFSGKGTALSLAFRKSVLIESSPTYTGIWKESCRMVSARTPHRFETVLEVKRFTLHYRPQRARRPRVNLKNVDLFSQHHPEIITHTTNHCERSRRVSQCRYIRSYVAT